MHEKVACDMDFMGRKGDGSLLPSRMGTDTALTRFADQAD